MYLTYSSDLTWRVEWLQHCPVWCGDLKWQGPISVIESQTAAAVKECMRYHITQTTVDVILYPYPNTSQLMFVKGPLQANKIRIYTIADHKCLAFKMWLKFTASQDNQNDNTLNIPYPCLIMPQNKQHLWKLRACCNVCLKSMQLPSCAHISLYWRLSLCASCALLSIDFTNNCNIHTNAPVSVTQPWINELHEFLGADNMTVTQFHMIHHIICKDKTS